MKYLCRYQREVWYFRSDVLLDDFLILIAKNENAKVWIKRCSDQNPPVDSPVDPKLVSICELLFIREAEKL
jgi:hypothetical protein